MAKILSFNKVFFFYIHLCIFPNDFLSGFSVCCDGHQICCHISEQLWYRVPRFCPVTYSFLQLLYSCFISYLYCDDTLHLNLYKCFSQQELQLELQTIMSRLTFGLYIICDWEEENLVVFLMFPKQLFHFTVPRNHSSHDLSHSLNFHLKTIVFIVRTF